MAERATSLRTAEGLGRAELESGIRQARSTVEDLDRQTRSFVRERPFVALVLAVAVGYLSGRLLSRL
jgi:ElaB/YqjD/DUF883 family membrane-anchored ribosome-binding protein